MPAQSPIDRLPPIDERDAVDPETFVAEVSSGYRPVVLRGQARDWPAVAAAAQGNEAMARYIARFDRGRPADVMIGQPAIDGRYFYSDDMTGLNFHRQQVPITALLGELLRLGDAPDPPALYAGAAAAGDHLPGWADDNNIGIPTPNATPRVWIGNATRISTHFDQSANLAVVVAGRRRFVLFPPEQLPNLYIGPLDNTLAGQPVSMVDPDAPDLERYPRFAQAVAHAQVAVLEPGDAIFMPSLWWHAVRAQTPFNVLVNYWWGQEPGVSAFDSMIHAMMAIRTLPPAERQAWRSWFDHYVFDDLAAKAADHLPPHARGIVGGAGSGWAARIRQYLIRGLDR